ncbi:hypothetical protein HG530_002677 [Fusarium avenaceum]|nr:hypothetical protein HG530_002677 [Fusarium avenaceum]
MRVLPFLGYSLLTVVPPLLLEERLEEETDSLRTERVRAEGWAHKEEDGSHLEGPDDLEDVHPRGEQELDIPHDDVGSLVGGQRYQGMIVGEGSPAGEGEKHGEDSLAPSPSLGHQYGEPMEEGHLALAPFLAGDSEAHRRSSGGHGPCRLRRSNRGQVGGRVAHQNGRDLVCCVCTSDHRRSDYRIVHRGLARSDRDPSVRPLWGFAVWIRLLATKQSET